VARRTPGLTAVAGALLVLVAVGSLSPWSALLLQPEAQQTSDFQILHAAGQGLGEGLDIHDPQVLDAVGQRVGRPSTPFCAALPVVLGAFGLFGPELGRAYELGLIGAALAALVAVLALAACLSSELSSRRERPEWGVALALALLIVGLPASFWHALAMNSTNLVTLAALSLAWWAGARGRVGLEGLALCVAILAKTSPALVLVTLTLSGRLAPVLWTVGWLASSFVGAIAWLGWEVHASWFTRVLPVLGYAPEVLPGRFNNSLHAWNLAPNGLLTRAAEGVSFWAGLGAWLVTALVLTQLLGAVRTRNAAPGAGAESARPEPDVGWLYALSVAAMFLVSSVTWPHHLVFAAIPGCWLVGQALRLGLRADRGRPATVLAGLVAWGVLALPLGLFGETGTQAVDIPVKTVACLALFAAVVSAAGQDTRAAEPDDDIGGDERAAAATQREPAA
jgi:hypothetical protein